MHILRLAQSQWSWSPTLKSWIVRLWLLSCFVLMLCSNWAVEWVAPPPQSHPSVHWQATHARWLEPALPRPAPEVVVSLPDSWKMRGLPPNGMVRYTTVATLTQAQALQPDEPWALRIDHLCSEHRVRVNGDLLLTTHPEQHMRGKMLPVLVDIPTRLLKPGDNTVVVDSSCIIQGGMSGMALAPQQSLKASFDNRDLFTIQLPLAMNVAGFAFGLFLLMLWWFRTDNRAIGLMGVVTLVASVRNCSYYVQFDLAWNPAVVSWLHYAAHTVVTCVFGLASLGLTNTRWELYRKSLLVVLATFPVIGLLALPFDSHLFLIRGSLQVVLIVLSVPSLWILLRASREWRMVSIMAFTLGSMAMAAATLRDYVLIRFLGDSTAMYWTAVSFPLSLPGLYLVIAERYTKALEDVARANQTLEQRVQERTADLETANAAKGHFLAAASHDLRQPMVAIGLITGLLRDRIKEPELRTLTSRLSEAVESMEDLLSRLLDLSRLEAGAVELKPQRVALQPLFDAIVAHECETAKAKGLSISMHAPHAAVWCDPMLLEQVLRNLVGNAVRYTKQGRVLVGARRRGRNWLIQVWDTGVGIAAQDQRRIFEDFVQLDNPGRNLNGGLGLGLALVQRAARLMGTQVDVRSRPGHGSCFSIVLPVAGQPRPMPAPDPLPSVADGDTPLQGQHILLLEDDRAVRLALERRLQAWGAQVTSTASLAELRLVLVGPELSAPPHVLLTDLSLGDGDGLQARDEARQRWPQLPVVIVTGDTAPARLQTLADSAMPVLHKPFKLEDLLRTLINAR
jgi:signal transduction histidine kinase